jgi:tRNA U55 pseudouridine synthase TruB
MFSALKQEGRRLHELAREGKVVERTPRLRHVHRFELVEWNCPRARFVVTCSAGTYVRTLAHDLGEKLGPGACVERLVRTGVGPHLLEGAVPYDLLPELSTEALLQRSLTPADALLEWPAIRLGDPVEIRAVRCGSWGDPTGRVTAPGGHRILDPAGNLLALVEGGPPLLFLRVLSGEGDGA